MSEEFFDQQYVLCLMVQACGFPVSKSLENHLFESLIIGQRNRFLNVLPATRRIVSRVGEEWLNEFI